MVTFTKDERDELMEIINNDKHTSQKFRNAYILLNCDRGEYGDPVINEQISNVLKVGMRTIDRVKKRFVEQGFDQALQRKPADRVYYRKADGDVEAHMVALSCSEPPIGHANQSLRLLPDRMVELNFVESISHETVRRVKKKRIKLWKSQGWVIPPDSNSEFVAHMEQVLDIYKRPYDQRNPVICMDEFPKQLIGSVRPERAMSTGRLRRQD